MNGVFVLTNENSIKSAKIIGKFGVLRPKNFGRAVNPFLRRGRNRIGTVRYGRAFFYFDKDKRFVFFHNQVNFIGADAASGARVSGDEFVSFLLQERTRFLFGRSKADVRIK